MLINFEAYSKRRVKMNNKALIFLSPIFVLIFGVLNVEAAHLTGNTLIDSTITKLTTDKATLVTAKSTLSTAKTTLKTDTSAVSQDKKTISQDKVTINTDFKAIGMQKPYK